MDKGWIKLHRKTLDNPIVAKDADYMAVWCYILLNATYEEYSALFRGEKITLKPGQLITGCVSIGERFKISESKVRRILNSFKADGQIEIQTSNRNSLITVLNWTSYQDGAQADEPKKSAAKSNKSSCQKKKTVYFPDDEPLESAFQEFLSMRIRTKKPLTTQQGINRAINKVRTLSNGDNDLAVKLLQQSVDHCWQDIYPLKNYAGSGQRNDSQFQRLMEQIRSDEENDD